MTEKNGKCKSLFWRRKKRESGVHVRSELVFIFIGIGSSPSTISREFRRNSGGRGYRFSQAQRMAWERRSETSSVPRKMTGRMWAIVEGKLAMQWSPEQISGRLRLDEVVSVSAEWIYRHVWEDKRNGGDLYKHLRRRGKKRNAGGAKGPCFERDV